MAVQREKLVRNAEKLVSRGKIEAAIREYRKLLVAQPKDTNTLNRVGDLYARIQRMDEAVRLFKQIAGQYTDEGFFVKAIAIYKKIIKLDPTRLSVYERLAELYHRQGLINEARTQYQVLADYYVKQEKSSSAASIYQRMAELEPDDPSHRAKLAELYQEQRLLDKAMEQYGVIAAIMLSHQQVEQAEQVLLRGLDVNPEDLAFIRSAVDRLSGVDEPEAALRFARAAAERNPEAMAIVETLEAAPRIEPSQPEPQAEVAPQQPFVASAPQTHELVLDNPGEFLADDAELMDALREADVAVGEGLAPPGGGEAGRGEENLEITWDEEDPESQVQPPADMLGRPGLAGRGFPEAEALDFDLAEDLTGDLTGDLNGDLAEDLSKPDRSDSQTFELDLGDLGDLEGLGAEETPEIALESVLEVAAEELADERSLAERPADPPAEQDLEPEPAVTRQDQDFLSEAEVLAKYGLTEKALERVQQVLQGQADHPAALCILIQLQLEEGEDDAAREAAERLASLPGGRSTESWARVVELFADAEVELPPAPPIDEPAEEPIQETVAEDREVEAAEDFDETGSVDLVLDDLDLEDPDLEVEVDEGQVVEAAGPGEAAAVEDELVEDELEVAAPVGGFIEVGVLDELEGALEAPDAEALDQEALDAEALGQEVLGQEALSQEDSTGARDDLALEGASIDAAGSLEDQSDAAALAELATEDPEAERPARRRTPETSRRINRLLESLLDEIPTTGKGKRRRSQDSVVDQLLDVTGRRAKRKSKAPAIPDQTHDESVEEEAPVQLEDVLAALTGDGSGEAERDAATPPLEDSSEGLVEVQIGAPEEEVDPFELDDHSDIEDALSFMQPAPGSIPTQPVPSTPAAEVLELDETGTGWLDEVSSEASAGAEEELFSEEKGFFDLGAELEEELSVSDAVGTESGGEQSLEEIVEGFKQGVAEQLSPEDFDTHFDLGIAYREMGLVDEAIGEFQVAAKAPQHLVQCCSMLGICFLEKGLPELAIKWYSRGLKAPQISEDDSLALLYDLGEVYLSTGDESSAHKAFVEVYGLNTNFRAIAAKVAETQPS